MKYILLFIFFGYNLCAQVGFENVRIKIENNEIKEGLQLLDSCSKAGNHVDSVYYYKALLLLKDLKTRAAKQTRDKLTQEFPDFYLVHYLNGIMHFENKNYGKSIEAFSEVIKAEPRNLKALYNRALALGMLEDYDAAREDLSALLEIAPNFSQAYYSRAFWHELNGKYEEAIKDYELAIEHNVKNYDAYLGTAHCYFLLKKVHKACEILNKAIEAGSFIAAEVKEIYCR
jgi:tetratricopeptide (TPR) repeat protein